MLNDRINGLFSAKVISYPDNAGFPWSLVQKIMYRSEIKNVIFDVYQKEKADITITEEEINKFYGN